jgi:hypothetical protein
MEDRFDPTTRQKVDDLAKRFRRPCAAVLCHFMQWGLSYERIGGLDQGDSQDPMRHLYLYVAPDLHGRLEKAAAAAGLKTAPWLRHTVHQITTKDFSTTWQQERSERHSHDSRTCEGPYAAT